MSHLIPTISSVYLFVIVIIITIRVK